MEYVEELEAGKQLVAQTATLYVFRGGQWARRGRGTARLLRDAEGLFSLVLRDSSATVCGHCLLLNIVVRSAQCILTPISHGFGWQWLAEDRAVQGDDQVVWHALHFRKAEHARLFQEKCRVALAASNALCL